jgi:hypothetical protein
MDSDDEKLTKPKASKKQAPAEPTPAPAPVKKERTEKQKEAFEKARAARQEYLDAKNKKATLVAAKAELNGKTAKQSKPKVLPNPVSQDSDDDYEKADDSDVSTEVEEVIYVKKAPKKKKKVVKKIIVEPSDDETDNEEDEPEPPKPAKKKAKPVIAKREEESEEEEVQVPTRNTRSQQNKNAKIGVATGKVNQRMLHYFMD